MALKLKSVMSWQVCTNSCQQRIFKNNSKKIYLRFINLRGDLNIPYTILAIFFKPIQKKCALYVIKYETFIVLVVNGISEARWLWQQFKMVDNNLVLNTLP